MKNLFILLCVLFTFPTLAQTPQGFTYQAVATDNNGLELVSQAISIKASVLSGSANGAVEWEETHATSTDDFGLFTLVVGQGINTTNGAQSTFADISWGASTHFLKIEMDITGGSIYSFMGTNQMMSVPYALYAESANINYDSISNYLSEDSTFITNVGGGMGGGGCDYGFPEGLDGDAISLEFHNTSPPYTVPTGKTLYITNVYSSSSGMDILDDDGNWSQFATNMNNTNSNSGSLKSPIVLNEGRVIQFGVGGFSLNGILINSSSDITSVVYNLAGANNNTYQVPIGKRLYITHVTGGQNTFLTSSGTPITTSGDIGQPIILNSSESINGFSNFNGYLVDENYFANCGGGGSISESSSEDNEEYTNFTKINANQNDSTLLSAIPNKPIIITGYLTSCHPENQSIDIIFGDEEYNLEDNIKGAGWISYVENGSSLSQSEKHKALDDFPYTHSGFRRNFMYEFKVSHPMDIIIYSTNSCGYSPYLIQY